MPGDDAPPDVSSGRGAHPGADSRKSSAADRAFERVLRDLLEQSTATVTAPPGLAARVLAGARPRRQERRRWLMLTAAALATSTVVLGALVFGRHLAGGSGDTGGAASVIAPATGSARPGPAATVRRSPSMPRPGGADSSPAGPSAGSPLTYGVPAGGSSAGSSGPAGSPATGVAQSDQAAASEITKAFTEAFDADENVDDGLAYVENGSTFHDMTVRFGQRYPGLVGNLKVRLENISLVDGDHATATIILNHTDPKLGAQWGYEIRRDVTAIRIKGRWLVSASTYSFLVGTA
ncbi:SnoaL-like domain-containing protein [Frankia sp. AiPs1]|uniref:hypothetical protein n=1 Tax=Frankia sp. AiPa1 TaxID=573492 RepID=UPI00202ADB45|nr:hypothetical protein [Frankia sp. AiPa1]MCL9758842.1 hypothetical protein [Frankia sp. AiPa1]